MDNDFYAKMLENAEKKNKKQNKWYSSSFFAFETLFRKGIYQISCILLSVISNIYVIVHIISMFKSFPEFFLKSNFHVWDYLIVCIFMKNNAISSRIVKCKGQGTSTALSLTNMADF